MHLEEPEHVVESMAGKELSELGRFAKLEGVEVCRWAYEGEEREQFWMVVQFGPEPLQNQKIGKITTASCDLLQMLLNEMDRFLSQGFKCRIYSQFRKQRKLFNTMERLIQDEVIKFPDMVSQFQRHIQRAKLPEFNFCNLLMKELTE